MPFSSSVQYVRNADIMVQCEECEKWRLAYSKYKLTAVERANSKPSPGTLHLYLWSYVVILRTW